MENAKEFQKNIYIYLCFTHYSNAYDHLDHKMVGNSWEEIGAPNHLTGLLRNLYAAQEVTVRLGHGKEDRFKIRQGIQQVCILSSWLFTFYAEYIMWNARRDESLAGIKTAGRNINNLRYADDTTLMAESEEEIKSLLTRVKRKVKKLAWNSTLKERRSWHPIPLLHGK